jgi:glycerol-3-phosphate dehydrogenase
VVNATGVWADRLDPEVSLRPSKGAHLVVRAPGLAGLSAALTVPVPGERNRFLLVIPREADTVHLGLTDDPLDGPLSDDSDVPHADADDAAFLLDTVSTALATPLTPADVVGSFAGLRPLAAGADPATRTADLSRRHVVARSSTGLLSVFGGKLTTYRRMAQDAVDALGLPAAACRTARLPLVGAASREALARVAAPARLVARFGADAPAVAALADDDPRLLEPVVPGLPVLGVELVFGVVAEGAMSVEDLLERRTRLGFFPAQVHEAVPAAEQALKRWLTPRAD